MVLLSLLAEVPALRYLIGIALGAVSVYFTLRMKADSKTPLKPHHKYNAAKDSIENSTKPPTEPLDPTKLPDAPVSVNYFPSRECNYSCGFCFHTATTSFILSDTKTKQGLKLLAEAGMRKLNIAGGEPFLNPKLLSSLLRYCKEDLGIESTSIVSNGSKIRESWMRDNAKYLDILAISCDSFNADTNIKIGRGGDGRNTTRLFQIAEWCRKYDVKFKLNTVVNIYNWDEDMAANVQRLAPFRWKVFQCLIVAGENEDETRLRDARTFLISKEQWNKFCERHQHLPCFVPEDNESMAGSYLNLDEHMRFLDKGEGMMKKSESILDVGVEQAMQQIVWDTKSFVERGGIYDWGRGDMKTAGNCGGSSLDLQALQF